MEAGLQGGSLSPALSEWVELCVVLPLRPWCLLPSYPPRGLRPAWVRARLEAGGPLGIRVQPERPSGTSILWAVERLAE